MGVRDYGSILANREEEQCLTVFSDREDGEPPLSDDMILTVKIWDEELEEMRAEKLEVLLREGPLLEEVMEQYRDDECGVGESEAFLLLIGKGDDGERLSFFLPVYYSWSDWDFHIDPLDRPDGRNYSDYIYLGYAESTDWNLPWQWNVSKKTITELTNSFPDLARFKGPVKVINFTPRSYNILVNPETLSKMTDEELIHLTEKAEIRLESIAKKTRREVFNLLRDRLMTELKAELGEDLSEGFPTLLSIGAPASAPAGAAAAAGAQVAAPAGAQATATTSIALPKVLTPATGSAKLNQCQCYKSKKEPNIRCPNRAKVQVGSNWFCGKHKTCNVKLKLFPQD